MTEETSTYPQEMPCPLRPTWRRVHWTEVRSDILEIEPSSISESSSFAEDLDADSLALIELVEGLEEELGERSVGFRIDDEDLEELRTVRDAVDYVYAKLGGS